MCRLQRIIDCENGLESILMKELTVSLDDGVAETVERLANDRGVTLSELLSELIEKASSQGRYAERTQTGQAAGETDIDNDILTEAQADQYGL